LHRESASANFKPESFEIYAASAACEKTRAQLASDTEEAKALYRELVQLCIVEIQNILSAHQGQLSAQVQISVQLFLSQCHICEQNLDFEWFRLNFAPLLHQVLLNFNLGDESLTQ
jgi:hypothetical protein